MQEIDIGDLADRVQCSTATLRFYEEKGLIKSIGRKGLRRQYSINTIHIVALIKLMKNGGLSLKDIQNIFIKDQKIKVNQDILEIKMSEMVSKVQTLQRSLEVLKHIQSCPYPEHMECPEFQKLISIKNT
ncbi:MerR family transcriptional regulator [Acinetobacter sp. HY1485]|uniref:MerR family transcriptional regulator n=1 Tax=Acinetobacter sp. HY1485 TaxID=2970918 RepID=UPI0022B99A85|nr:MerR family transcriptional regulator [Acinetobacter sp. HY1485]